MDKIEKKILQLETHILGKHINEEKELLINEMKKIGIEKLPYSYSALKQFIDPETMNFHYNKHYKGYVDKLNSALSKKKYGDLELEQIIKSISRFDKTIRNNAGGAFNHALFWNMLTPDQKKLTGPLYDKIAKEFGTFNLFKKKFEAVAKDRFGSGWVWLVLNSKNKLKIMSTPNQDNPLMNVIEGGGFPILGLDLWEHAYYLKYKNKRDEYISNFWKVVNWDFVSKLYEMKTKTKLLESESFRKIISESKEPKFCEPKETVHFKALIDVPEFKRIYQTGITNALKKVFSDFWVESEKDEMSGFYGIESEQGRSILNNLNTNFNTFCLLTKAVNKEILRKKPDGRTFNFTDNQNKNIKEVMRFVKCVDIFRKEIFNKDNEDFINIINVLNKLWKRGQKSENDALKKIEDYFGEAVKIEKIGGHGKTNDAIKGIDLKIELSGETFTAQVKPFSTVSIIDNKIEFLDTGNVKPYEINWYIFIQPKTNKIIIMKNNPISTDGTYIFKIDDVLHEIN